MRLLSLFSGIGGIELGLERAGMTLVGQCEIEPFCRSILKRHWPDAYLHDDIRTLTGEITRERCGQIDIIAGGFPCQDISCAGSQEGIHADRSGLWWEMQRLIRELRPRWVLVENVNSLRKHGADEVLGSLEEIGYRTWPLVVGAWAGGAPHNRERAWIVGYSEHYGLPTAAISGCYAEKLSWRPQGQISTVQSEGTSSSRDVSRSSTSELADSDGAGREGRISGRTDSRWEDFRRYARLCGTSLQTRWPLGRGTKQYEWEQPRLVRLKSSMGGTVDGISSGVDEEHYPRIVALGNAVVPQVVEMVGRSIMTADATITYLK